MKTTSSVNMDIEIWRAISKLAKQKKTGTSKIIENILKKDQEIQKIVEKAEK